MSFPTFKFKELVEEDWEDSTFGKIIELVEEAQDSKSEAERLRKENFNKRNR